MVRQTVRDENDRDDALAAALSQWHQDARGKKKRTGRDRGRMLHRHRRQLAPWYAAGGLVVLAIGANTVVPWLIGKPLAIAAVTGVGVLAMGVAGFAVWHRLSPHWRLRASLAAPFAVAWLPWAAEAVSWVRFAVIVPVFLILKARHDREQRHADPTSRPRDDQAIPTSVAERWEAFVGGDGYALPGSVIGKPRVETNGVATTEVYDGRLMPGKQTVASARANMPLIASGLGGRVQEYLIDDHPTARDSSRFVFKVIRKGPGDQPVFYSGPRYRDGKVELGPYMDGVGSAAKTVYYKRRIKNGLIIGQTGIGKSRVNERICLDVRAQGHTVIIFIDGQDGLSSPVLRDEAWAFVPLDGAEAARHALREIQRYRQGVMLDQRLSGFDPTPEFPGILTTMDEAHSVFDRHNAKHWAALVNEANKVGEGFLVCDQDGSLTTFHESALRAGLQSGDTIGMRVTERDAGQVLNDSTFNLADLPMIPGYSHMLATGVPARQAPFRNEWLPDSQDRADGLIPSGLMIVDEWYREYPGIDLDEGSTQRWFSVMSGAGSPQPMTAAPELAGDVIQFPTPLVIAEPTSRDKVLAAIESGHETHGAIVDATGLSDRTVRDKRTVLADEGLVVNDHGKVKPVVDRSANPGVRADPPLAI